MSAAHQAAIARQHNTITSIENRTHTGAQNSSEGGGEGEGGWGQRKREGVGEGKGEGEREWSMYTYIHQQKI